MIKKVLKIEEILKLLDAASRIEDLTIDTVKTYFYDNNKELLTDENNSFCCISYEIDEAEIDYIAIDSSIEGKGYGSLFLKDIEMYLVTKGIKTIFLEVRKSNDRAIRFYKRNGYEEYRRRKDYYENPVEDALCYRKALDGKR